MSLRSDVKAIELGGEKKESITSLTLVNNVAKTIDITVPTNKKWLLLGIKAANPDNVDRAINTQVFKEAAKTNLLSRLLSNSTATLVVIYWPSAVSVQTSARAWHPRILEAGNVISTIWAAGGASAGGTDADGLIIEYLELAE